MTTPTTAPVSAFELRGITKRFGALCAVDDVSLAVRAGTVHALMGENGAGKSTLMRIAFGLLAPDAGQLVLQDEPVAGWSAARAIAGGLGMVHQHFTNVPAMTVAENVALGRHGRFDRDAARQRVIAIGKRTGLALDPDARAGDLPVGAQQRLEIVKALARDTRLLILDEPTAVLAPSEAEELLRWLRGFADDGSAVVLITHKLSEAFSIADDVTVLRHGRRVLAAPRRDASMESAAAALLGESASLPALQRASLSPVETAVGLPSKTLVRIENLRLRDEAGSDVVRGVSFEISRGEIVGIAAVEGSGQRELLRALARRQQPASGHLQVPDDIGFIPEDRHRDALILDFTLVENVALKAAGSRRGLMAWDRESERTVRLVREHDVRGEPLWAARQLSGGNQQKLVLARELDDAPALVVAENPTRGLDIRATGAVHDRLRAAAAAGAAVVVYSSDLDEVLALSTRVLALHAGRVCAVQSDRALVGRAMLGVA